MAAITEQRELYLFEGYSSNKNMGANFMRKDDMDDDDDTNYSLRIDKFIIKQHLNEIFTDETIIDKQIAFCNHCLNIQYQQFACIFQVDYRAEMNLLYFR